MANLNESPIWEDNIYLIEEQDLVQGGEYGIDNLPHKALANRTLYLKRQVEELKTINGEKDVIIRDLKSQIDGLDAMVVQLVGDLEARIRTISNSTANSIVAMFNVNSKSDYHINRDGWPIRRWDIPNITSDLEVVRHETEELPPSNVSAHAWRKPFVSKLVLKIPEYVTQTGNILLEYNKKASHTTKTMEVFNQTFHYELDVLTYEFDKETRELTINGKWDNHLKIIFLSGGDDENDGAQTTQGDTTTTQPTNQPNQS